MERFNTVSAGLWVWWTERPIYIRPTGPRPRLLGSAVTAAIISTGSYGAVTPHASPTHLGIQPMETRSERVTKTAPPPVFVFSLGGGSQTACWSSPPNHTYTMNPLHILHINVVELCNNQMCFWHEGDCLLIYSTAFTNRLITNEFIRI